VPGTVKEEVKGPARGGEREARHKDCLEGSLSPVVHRKLRYVLEYGENGREKRRKRTIGRGDPLGTTSTERATHADGRYHEISFGAGYRETSP